MKARRRVIVALVAAISAAAVLVAYPSVASHIASSDTAGHSTLEQTIIGDDQQTVDDRSDPPFSFLDVSGPGEPYLVREELTSARGGRRDRRNSMIYFGQLSDFQLSDEESPARVEFLDKEPTGFASSAWRPQEALLAFEVDQSIRQLNRFQRSPVRQANGERATLANTILTGDLADNQQLNETRWVVKLLEGGMLNPGSGTNDLAGTACEGKPLLDPTDQPRNYTGVQDYDDYPVTDPGNGDRHYYDPAELRGYYERNDWPLYTSGAQRTILDEAQEPFRARGLQVPSYVALGNHDSLVQGNQWASNGFNDIAVGCMKVFPFSADELPDAPPGGEDLVDGLPPFEALLTSKLTTAQATPVPPDPDRRFIDEREYRSSFGRAQQDHHGFSYIDRDQQRRSEGTASYYDFSPAPGIRYIALDTVSEGGMTPQSSDGNIDDPQWRWLQDELRQATRRGELVIVFGHHATGSLTANVADEAPPQPGPWAPGAPRCHSEQEQDAEGPGCDRDPRESTPIHLGEDLKRLFLRFPHVVTYVAGHSHENQVTPFEGDAGGAFWEIKSPAIADWTTQHRLLEVMDNRDGTLSIFGTMLDDASPSQAPAGEDAGQVSAQAHAGSFTPEDLAALSRTIAYNDPQQGTDGSEGQANDRNVELLLRDPRLLGPGGGARECKGRNATIVGTSGEDEIEGTAGRDVIVARGGADEVHGRGGDDVICGGGGPDLLFGGSGGDKVFGGKARDRARGGADGDRLTGGEEMDVLAGGSGSDRLSGRDGRDTLRGGGEEDRLRGGAGDDTVHGQHGDDGLSGGSADDFLDGGPQSDTCRGGGGFDRFRGCEG